MEEKILEAIRKVRREGGPNKPMYVSTIPRPIYEVMGRPKALKWMLKKIGDKLKVEVEPAG